MIVGTLAALRRYPVKSLRGETLESAEVTADGIAGDRTSALFVRSGHARTAKTYRGKENDRLHLLSSVDAARADAHDRGVELERRDGDRFFDTAPISLLVDRWLEELSAHLGYTVQWQRFRPNLYVRANADFAQPEATLEGTELHCGTVRLRVRKPIERCVVITYDLDGGPSDREILRYVAEQRESTMGVYCDVLEPGAIAVGDELTRINLRDSKEAPFNDASAHTR